MFLAYEVVKFALNGEPLNSDSIPSFTRKMSSETSPSSAQVYVTVYDPLS